MWGEVEGLCGGDEMEVCGSGEVAKLRDEVKECVVEN